MDVATALALNTALSLGLLAGLAWVMRIPYRSA